MSGNMNPQKLPGKILVTGAMGQIGSELTSSLKTRYGEENVYAADIKAPKQVNGKNENYFNLDCTDKEQLAGFVRAKNIKTIYHLVAILSANAEKNPQLAWNVNMNSLFNILETAREFECSVFVPSSIAAFGRSTPKENTPQDTIQRPETIYGITKVAGELLCDYYFKKYNVDVRGVRYPGIISYKTLPGGGTTDYAVEIYYAAVKEKIYSCYLSENTYLDMMYMPDAIKAAIELMEADPNKLKHRNSYNVTAMSINPKLIADEIKKVIPEFKIEYNIDSSRQAIADTWPQSINDQEAREDWNWKPGFDLESMTKDMIENLTKILNVNTGKIEEH